MSNRLKPIGVVRSPFKKREDIDTRRYADARGFESVRGKLEIFEEYADGLKDTEGFSHLIVIYLFHESRKVHLLTVPFLDDQLRGIFSTRSPHRPNRLGLTVLKVLNREGRVLRVSGIDMLEGTPIVDIKPYTPRDVKSPIRIGWLAEKMKIRKNRRKRAAGRKEKTRENGN